MKEYNLITIYYDRTTNPKDKSMEIDEYVGTIILEILEKKGIAENDEILIDLTDTFLQTFKTSCSFVITSYQRKKQKKGT